MGFSLVKSEIVRSDIWEEASSSQKGSGEDGRKGAEFEDMGLRGGPCMEERPLAIESHEAREGGRCSTAWEALENMEGR